jgi:hypothetical protein
MKAVLHSLGFPRKTHPNPCKTRVSCGFGCVCPHRKCTQKTFKNPSQPYLSKGQFPRVFWKAVEMIELETLMNDLNRLYVKEKGMRKRIYLEQALSSLKQYEKQIALDETRKL